MKTWQDRAVEFLDDLLSVRSMITLGAFYTVYFLVWTSREIPPIMAHITDILLGFWFGQKIAKLQNKGAGNVE